jgi:hypothetical protein
MGKGKVTWLPGFRAKKTPQMPEMGSWGIGNKGGYMTLSLAGATCELRPVSFRCREGQEELMSKERATQPWVDLDEKGRPKSLERLCPVTGLEFESQGSTSQPYEYEPNCFR